MTADDVVFSYNTVIHGGYADTSTSAMDRAEKVDDSHVRVVFKAPYGPALVCIATSSMTIFPKAYYEADPDYFLRNPIGTGPYQFVSWKSGDSITLKRNEKYHLGPAPIENVIFRIFVDSSVAAIALENGDIDVLTNPLQTDCNLLMNNPDITYDETESAMVTWGFFNCAPGQRFNDKRLREAISYAIDREACIQGAMEGAAVLVNSMYPNYIPLGWPEYQPVHKYDPDKARALLAACGYGPNNPLKINFQGRETPHYAKPSEVIQAQLADVGIEMTLEKLEAGAWGDNVLRKSNFEFNLIATTIGFLDFDERYSLFVSNQPQNFYNVADAALDDAFNRNRNSSDIEVRRQACRDIIRIMDEEALIVPIYGNMRGIASQNGLKGIKADPGYRYDIREWSW
jgi:peptide/nickel transport system substrate-binding protein